MPTPTAGIDLSDTDLSGTDLSGANLSGVTSARIIGIPASLPTNWMPVAGYLVGPTANLSGADLAGADLTGADLAGADLDQISRRRPHRCLDLAGDSFEFADPRRGSRRVDLGARLHHATLPTPTRRPPIRMLDPTSSDLAGTPTSQVPILRMRACTRPDALTAADLSGADLEGVDLSEVDSGGIAPARSFNCLRLDLVCNYLIDPGATRARSILTGASLPVPT